MTFPYQEEYLLAMELVKEAANIFIPAFNSPKNIETKLSSSDLVTETDKGIEELLKTRIKARYPDHVFIGEETVSDGGKCVFSSSPTWIIDPVDGTCSFVHRYSHTCIVVAFTVNKLVQFGVVYNPVLNQLYTGRLGFGAQLNGFPIKVTGKTTITKSLLLCEMGSRRDEHSISIKCDNMRAVTQEPEACHGLRMQGSAALNICSVADGSADGYWESGMHIWDMAAASVILTEAGGCVVSPVRGESFDLLKRRIIAAASPELALALQKKIKHIDYPSD